MTEWFWQLGEQFTPERYIALTRIQGCLWTAADFVIITYLIRIGNLVRGELAMRRHRMSWVILAATFPFALALPIAPGGYAFFRLELAVTVPHFILIVYLCAINARPGAKLLARLTRNAPSPIP